MQSIQLIHLIIIIILGFGLSLFYFFPDNKFRSKTGIIISGILCSICGIGLSCLTDKNCFDVIFLIDTGGFGRAYIVGLGIMLSGFILLIAEVIKKFTTKKNNHV